MTHIIHADVVLIFLAVAAAAKFHLLVLAFLVSPFGLPAIGEWLLERLYGVKYALQDFMFS